MAVLPNAERSAACDAVVDRVDLGSGAGKLELCASSTVLATITLDDPAFGAASNGVATAAGFPKNFTASATGTCDNYKVRDSDNNLRWSGGAGGTGSGQECILDNPSLVNGQGGTVTSFTHTQPAGT
jgi:hypothetical protein